MTAKIKASSDGLKVTIGNAAEDALEIDQTAKTIKGINGYSLAGNGPAFRANLTSNQAVTSGVSTKALFNLEVIDTDGMYDAANSRFLPTVAGYYAVNVAARVDSATTSGVLSVAKNGTIYSQSSEISASTIKFIGCSDIVYLNGTTDYIEAFVTLTGTTPLINKSSDTATYFSGVLVRNA